MKKKNLNNQNLQNNEISIDNIVVTYNPRKYFDENTLNELAESIKNIGVIQPITVRPLQDNDKKYELICGERRLRASKIAKRITIPAYILECSDEERKDIACIENLQREDVREIEIAEAIQGLFDNGKEDFNSIATRLGKSIKYVRDRYKLNNLIDDIKQLVNNESLSIAKAILLSSYSHEIQNEVFNEYLSDEDCYYYWGSLTLKQFENKIDIAYNSNLNIAEFDISDCKNCIYNSNTADLFASDAEHGRCLNKDCFINKLRSFKIDNVMQLINKNPEYLIINNNASTYLINALNENGIETAKCKYKQFPRIPEAPRPPQENEYQDENGKLDEEWFTDAQEDYKNELKEYEEDIKKYEEDIKTIEQAEKERKIERCYVFNNDKLIQAYRQIAIEDVSIIECSDVNDEEETSVLNLQSSKKAQLAKLQDKDLRNQEIKVEHIVEDLKKSVFIDRKDLFNKKGNDLDSHILFYYLISNLSNESKKELFGKEYPTDKEKYECVLKLTEDQKTTIIRSYILKKLRSNAFNAYLVDTQLMIDFAKLHFEEETKEIELKHTEIYNKRKESIDAKIEEIKKNSNTEAIKEEN